MKYKNYIFTTVMSEDINTLFPGLQSVVRRNPKTHTLKATRKNASGDKLKPKHTQTSCCELKPEV